jgi:hypothetical protein
MSSGIQAAGRRIRVGFHVASSASSRLGGDTLEIGGVVIRGEGVVGPADSRATKCATAPLLSMLVRRLEHQVFEEMRDA